MNEYITKNCKNCDNVFLSTTRRKIFCSNECYMQTHSVIKGNAESRAKTIEYICQRYPHANLETLSNELGLSVAHIRDIAYKKGVLRDGQSLEKQYGIVSEYMTDSNPMFRPEVVAKVSDYWKAHPEERKVLGAKGRQSQSRKNPSKLELRCAEYLAQLGIDYEHQAIIKDKFVVDFRMGNIILQCDGDYWHGHKRFEPLTERQLKQQKRDAAQDKYLQACGYTVIRIWESDLTMDVLRALLL